MIYDFKELLSHAGHDVECVYYGTPNQAVNAAIECVTCGCVLVDLSPGDTLSKTLEEDAGGNTIAHVWHFKDVKERAKERGILLSDDQCREILALIDSNKDAELGINWTVIDTVTDLYLEDVSKVKEDG